MGLTIEALKDSFLKMNQIRKFEEQVHQIFLDGNLHGTTHLYIGQEACAVGACAALNAEDYITSTHRGHGHCIAKGGELKPMMAEIYGKSTGYCKGKGGSMHIGHVNHGNLGANGVVGGGHAISVGGALAQKLKGEEGITLCFFGDGSTNEGSFHEALNMASVWKLPVIFFCENNYYGLSTPTRLSMNVSEISRRAMSYDIVGMEVDGNNFNEVYQAVKGARQHVQKNGPILIVANTYRMMGHSKSDTNNYRTQEEIDSWIEKDPIDDMYRYLITEKGIGSGELAKLAAQAVHDVVDAVEFAQKSPDPNPEELTKGVYAS